MGLEDNGLRRRLLAGMNEKVTGDRRVILELTADEMAELDRLIKLLVAFRRIGPFVSGFARVIMVIGVFIAGATIFAFAKFRLFGGPG